VKTALTLAFLSFSLHVAQTYVSPIDSD